MISHDKLLDKIAKAKADKDNWSSHLKECYRYAQPQRNAFDKASKGTKKREYIFDSTAERAVNDFALRLQSEIVPNNQNWMKLEAGTDIPENKKEVIDQYLEDTTKIVFDHISSSNFASQIHEAFLDLAISTGAIVTEYQEGVQSSLNFRCIPTSELLLEQSRQGIIENVYREFTIPVHDVKEIWPQAKLTPELEVMLVEKPTTEIELIEGTIKGKENYEVFLIYGEEFLFQEEVESSPWCVFRENTLPGEVWGRGRVMTSLADIKTLNLMVKDHLTAAAFSSQPIFTAANSGVLNPYTVVVEPGAIIPVDSNGNENPSLKPLQVFNQYDVLQYDIRALQDTIKSNLLSKPFGNVEETPVRTATEMSIRNADLAKTSLGASSRIQNELLERIVERCVYILKRAGKISDFKVDGKEVKIKFTSPSARSQDEHQLAALGRMMEMLVALPPELVQNELAIEKIPGEIVDILGLPSKLKRTDDEKAERAEQREQQEAQAQMMAQQGVANG